jgi:hypothetical protein
MRLARGGPDFPVCPAASAGVRSAVMRCLLADAERQLAEVPDDEDLVNVVREMREFVKSGEN